MNHVIIELYIYIRVLYAWCCIIHNYSIIYMLFTFYHRIVSFHGVQTIIIIMRDVSVQ